MVLRNLLVNKSFLFNKNLIRLVIYILITLSKEQLKEFLQEIKRNKNLYDQVSKVATANEIASIAKTFGYEFTGYELKAIENSELKGIKIRKQDTSPSYPFGESGN